MIQTVSSFATAVGLFLAVIGLRQVQRQRLRQFEALFVSRYWTLMDRLSLQAMRGDEHEPHRDEDERVVRAYLQLCEDELDLRSQGCFTDSTWAVWADGMQVQLQRWPFSQIWHRVEKDETGTFEMLREFNAGAPDPCQIPAWRRAVQGLQGGPG
jgi:hypothetical protein